MGLTTAQWLAGTDAASHSDDGRLALLRVRDKNIGFPALSLWDRTTAKARTLRLYRLEDLGADWQLARGTPPCQQP